MDATCSDSGGVWFVEINDLGQVMSECPKEKIHMQFWYTKYGRVTHLHTYIGDGK